MEEGDPYTSTGKARCATASHTAATIKQQTPPKTNMEATGSDIRLQVAGANERDVGKGMARITRGFTGADLENLVRKAGMQALRADPDVERIHMSTFEEALKETHASVTPEMEKEYEKLADQLKLERPDARQRLGFTVNGE